MINANGSITIIRQASNGTDGLGRPVANNCAYDVMGSFYCVLSAKSKIDIANNNQIEQSSERRTFSFYSSDQTESMPYRIKLTDYLVHEIDGVTGRFYYKIIGLDMTNLPQGCCLVSLRTEKLSGRDCGSLDLFCKTLTTRII